MTRGERRAYWLGLSAGFVGTSVGFLIGLGVMGR